MANTLVVPLWRNRDYVLLRGGQFVSTLGSGISGIVFPLLILALTNSPASAGIAAALRAVPYVIFSLPVGALVDRWDRKRVMLWCDLGRAVTLASIPIAMLFGVLTVAQLYLAALIEGSLFVLFNIAEVAAIARVVPKTQLPEAIAQNQAAYGIADIVGPSIGTLSYQAVSQAFPFVLDAISYVVSVISLVFIRTPLQSERPASAPDLRAEVVEGLRWLWHQRLIFFMALVTGGLHFVGAAERLIVIVLAKALGAQAAEIGLLFSVAGIGGIIGALIGSRFAKKFSFGQVIIGAIWLNVLLFPLYAAAPNLLVLGAITVLIFFIGPWYDIVQYSHRLSMIPDRLQGRVNSTWRLIAFGFDPLGAATSGFLLEWVGPVATVVVLSLWYLGVAILVTLNTEVRHASPVTEIHAL